MFRSLRAILKERTRKYSFFDEVLAAEVLELWQKIIKQEFGPQWSNKARAFYFKKGVLTVRVSHPDLLQELKLREIEIIKKINGFLKRNFISSQKLKKVVYKIGDF